MRHSELSRAKSVLLEILALEAADHTCYSESALEWTVLRTACQLEAHGLLGLYANTRDTGCRRLCLRTCDPGGKQETLSP